MPDLMGTEARDLCPGDRIVGIGTVRRSWIDEDGDVVVRLELAALYGVPTWVIYRLAMTCP